MYRGLKWLIIGLRFSLFFFLILTILFIVVFLLEITISESKILEHVKLNKDQLKKFVGILGFSSISLFLVDIFNKLRSQLGSKILNFVLARDVPAQYLEKEYWRVHQVSDFFKKLFRFLKENLKPLKTIKSTIYFIIIALGAWFAYLLFSSADSQDKGGHNHYYNSFYNSDLNSSNAFKLIFSFEHNDRNVMEYGDDEINTMSRFIQAFEGCLTDKKEAVVIEIVGFASETKTELSEIKEEVELANDRATNTYKILDSIKNKLHSSFINEYGSSNLNRVRVHVTEWEETREGYTAMINSRGFKEIKLENQIDSLSQRNNTSEYLNRRVEVWLVDAGGCD